MQGLRHNVYRIDNLVLNKPYFKHTFVPVIEIFISLYLHVYCLVCMTENCYFITTFQTAENEINLLL